MTDSIEFGKVIETATIDAQNSKGYIYNKMYFIKFIHLPMCPLKF